MTPVERKPPSTDLLFRGRAGDVRLGELVTLATGGMRTTETEDSHIIVGIFGSPDDLGVRRNRGRPGAALGPTAIRKHFYKMTPAADHAFSQAIVLVDFGDIVPDERDISRTHVQAHSVALEVASSCDLVIALGGGHDFAAPHFLGCRDGWNVLGGKKKQRLGIVNVDPHLDCRELEEGLPHSGTAMRQILESGTVAKGRALQFGAARSHNASTHWSWWIEKGGLIEPIHRIKRQPTPVRKQFREQLRKLGTNTDVLAVSFDMDACTSGAGVSAAGVLGFDASEMIAMAEEAGLSGKVRLLEIAETAPGLEPLDRTALIAAEMIHAFVTAAVFGNR